MIYSQSVGSISGILNTSLLMIRRYYEYDGIRFAIKMFLNWLSLPLAYLIEKYFTKNNIFIVESSSLSYLKVFKNRAFQTERSIEIPIAWNILQSTPSNSNILEVGNTLSHYLPCNHLIVDKYEKAPNVTNIDIIDYITPKKFDLILCISTLEHIGWDEFPQDFGKIIKTVNHLQSLLTENGKLVITIPTNYNPFLDNLLKSMSFPAKKIWALKRLSYSSNTWQESNLSEVLTQSFHPFYGASGLVVVQVAR
jgi:hypothetical protein